MYRLSPADLRRAPFEPCRRPSSVETWIRYGRSIGIAAAIETPVSMIPRYPCARCTRRSAVLNSSKEEERNKLIGQIHGCLSVATFWNSSLPPARLLGEALALRASPPMEPKAKAKRHECPTCGPVTGSPNVDPKQRRSRLNLGPPWMLTMGGPLLWPTDHPRMTDKESRWMADRHITVCMPRVTLSIGVGWLKMEPGDGQTVGGASKQVCLDWRASKRARLHWPCRWRSKTRAIACHGHEVD